VRVDVGSGAADWAVGTGTGVSVGPPLSLALASSVGVAVLVGICATGAGGNNVGFIDSGPRPAPTRR